MSSLTPEQQQARIAAVEITAKESQPPLTAAANERYQGYWQRLAELAHSDELIAATNGEGDQEPTRGQPLWQQPISRRRSLQLLGASAALANMTGCSRQPDEHILPYVNMPEHLVPGRPRFYATATTIGGYAQGILAESHEGRPTKIEGNPDYPASLGACDAISQASVLSLYDPDRSQSVRYQNSVAAMRDFVRDLLTQRQQWDSNGGAGLCVVLGPSTSPSEAHAVQQLQQRWPKSQWFMHDAVNRSNVYDGNEMVFGQSLEPIYHFDKAKVVVSLDADFMQSQPGFLRYARDSMQARSARKLKPGTQPARLYVLESTPSITGSVADHRRSLRWSEIGIAAQELAQALTLEWAMPTAGALTDFAGTTARAAMVTATDETLLPPHWLQALREDVLSHRGEVIIIAGDEQPPLVHALAQAMNHALGALGETVEYISPQLNHVDLPGLAQLTTAIQNNEVNHLLVLGANPAYDAPADLAFAERFQSVPWRMHFGEYHDETAHRARWHIPAAHPLETWADARAYDGSVSIIQPLIRPLYDGLSTLQMLNLLAEGTVQDARSLLQTYWQTAGASAFSTAPGGSHTLQRNTANTGSGAWDEIWRNSLQRGVIPNSAAHPIAVKPLNAWHRNVTLPLDDPELEEAADLLLQFRPDAAVWDGRYANNGWLQEMPRPVTTLTWDTALLISPATAEKYHLHEGAQVKLTTAVGERKLPVFILPGQPDAAVTIYLGQGHERFGAVAGGVGVNAYRLRTSDQLWALPVTLTATGATQTLALLQNHHSMEDRDLIRATSFSHYQKNPRFAQRAAETPEESLYPEEWPASRTAEHAWGMSIDLSACIGCNACVTACQAENNIPVVGAEEVARGHDMHWLRVDRYFSAASPSPSAIASQSAVQQFDPAIPARPEAAPDAPSNVFQPVPCMHCENAPCEYVCPVGATQHSADGLNEMIYQRCVGTRYCSQNCPYKVRRFNWFDYTSKTALYPNLPPQQNPDVSVRERGVMEKCTYCVQRISSVRQTAEAEQRPIREGELKTACQQTCPTQAIVFGDIADPHSEVSRLKAHPLNYDLLAHLNTRPRTSYLAAVRNPNPLLTPTRAGGKKIQGGGDDHG